MELKGNSFRIINFMSILSCFLRNQKVPWRMEMLPKSLKGAVKSLTSELKLYREVPACLALLTDGC